MNKHLFKPSFEFLFSVGVVVALAVPQFLLAQDRRDEKRERKEKEESKEVRIVINDKDTIFNGKKIKDLAPKEKEFALAEINKMTNNGPARIDRKIRSRIYDRAAADSLRTRVYSFRRDSGGLMFEENHDHLPDMPFRMERPNIHIEDFRYDDRPVRVRNLRRGNSQSFSYNNIGKDGISTHVNYQVSDAMAEEAKKVAGLSTSDLELQDLTLTPQFSAGKTILSFTLPAKTAADVQLTDSEGKAIWKDKATAAGFSKAFTWSLNGVYYLVVKQGVKTAVKRIVKE